MSAGLLGTRFLVLRIRGGKLSGGCACIFVRRAGSRVWWVAPRETYERLLFLLASLSVSPSKSLRLHFSVLPFSVFFLLSFSNFSLVQFLPIKKERAACVIHVREGDSRTVFLFFSWFLLAVFRRPRRAAAATSGGSQQHTATSGRP